MYSFLSQSDLISILFLTGVTAKQFRQKQIKTVV